MSANLSVFLDLPLEEKTTRGLLYTPTEIAQQPTTWETTFGIFKQHQQGIAAFLDAVGIRASLQERPSIILIGAGTSDYIAQALTFVLRKQWGCEVSAVASTDLLPNMDEYVIPGRRYLWISFSRSGDSPEAVAVLQQALERYPEIGHLVVTCNAKARMADLCKDTEHTSVIVLADAVNDRSLAMTSSFTNMIILGQCLAHAWSIADYEPIFQDLSYAGTQLLAQASVLVSRPE
jgi:tagatose-6-phosphate ketose/aldose isomerase